MLTLFGGKIEGKKRAPFFPGDGKNGAYNWRRPTLTGPIVPLPSAHKSFTSGFGMGPGGSSLLWPPEGKVQLFIKPYPLKASKRLLKVS